MRVWVLLGVGVLGLLVGCNRIETRAPGDALGTAPSGPNLVLVTIDTLRADHVGAYGHTRAETSVLDGWAREGALFETAISATPLTLPSHATLMTGVSPPAHGVRNNGFFQLGEEAKTLAEQLAGEGWQTAAVVGAIVLAPHYGIAQGFELFDAEMDGGRSSGGGYPERKADRVTERALAWLGRRERGRPFFLWLHYYDPHAVYEPPSPYRERFADAPYDGEIAFVDAQLRRLEAALRNAGELERTLISVTSDHGDSLGEHGEETHGYSLYDATQRVPWIVRGPGVDAGRRLDGVVAGVDVAPTLLGLMGLGRLEAAQGRDLSGWIAGGAPPPARPAYMETLATSLEHGWAPLHAVRTESELYVRAPRPELYAVGEDPDQLSNLLEQEPERHARAVQQHEARIGTELSREIEAVRLRPDAPMRAELEALGYLLPAEAAVASEIDPKDMIRHVAPMQEAHAQFRAGEFDAAAATTQRLLEVMPKSAELHALLGRIRLTQRRIPEAFEQASRAVALNPRSAYHQVLLGNVLIRMQKVDDALVAYAAAASVDPTYPSAHAGLMWRLERGGSLEAAEASAREAEAHDPGDGSGVLMVADQWDALGHYDLALSAYERALAIDPRSPAAHLGLAIELARIGDLSRVDRHLAMSGASAEPIHARMRLAIAFAGRGAFDRSERVLRGIVDEEPAFEPARAVLARVLEDQGRADEAARLREGV